MGRGRGEKENEEEERKKERCVGERDKKDTYVRSEGERLIKETLHNRTSL